MPQRGAPSITTLVLVFASGVAIGACRRQPTDVQPPENQLVVVEDEAVDTPMVCVDGCTRLERCIPELASEIDGDPTVVAERLANECAGACGSFGDRNAALALADCLNLGSCDAYWGCVGTAAVRPWLAAVAPVGERTCANLCAQASVCAVAKVCEAAPVSEARGQGEGEDPPKRPRPEKKPKDGKDGKPDDAGEPADEPATDPTCAQDRAQLDELEAHCVLQCEATPVDSRARTELIGCIDHASCDGLLRCLDTWSETDYADVDGPTPGISETCDAFCTRAIVCGAQQHDADLDPTALEELKQAMTSTYVECAVQCGKDLEVNGEAARANFERCTAVASCTDFSTCADEV
jgi:hypothetical protein